MSKTKAPRHTIAVRAGAREACNANRRSYEGEGGVMHWIRMALAVFAGGLVASLTDWSFMDDWLYKRYNRDSIGQRLWSSGKVSRYRERDSTSRREVFTTRFPSVCDFASSYLPLR